MRRWFQGFALATFAMLVAVSPSLAANAAATSVKGQPVTLAAPAATQPSSVQPVAAPATDPSHPRSVLVAQAPFATVWNATVLSANSKAMGLQTSRAVGRYGPIQMAIAGAAVGAIVGAVAGDPLTDAAIGGVVGFGVSYVMHR